MRSAILRDYFKLKRKSEPPSISVGEVPQNSYIIPFIPSTVTDKIPRLKGYRYTVDSASGALLIVSSRTLRVVEIVEAA